MANIGMDARKNYMAACGWEKIDFMMDAWIKLKDLPSEGRGYVIDEQAVWLEGLAQHEMSVRLLDPVRAEVMLLPQEQGFLVIGALSGSVLVPCDRCLTEFEVSLNSRFEEFEGLDEDDKLPEDDLLRDGPAGLELNLTGLVWEQFVLSLPEFPICDEDCPGLCPGCGRDLKSGSCSCAPGDEDPRLALFRGLKIN